MPMPGWKAAERQNVHFTDAQPRLFRVFISMGLVLFLTCSASVSAQVTNTSPGPDENDSANGATLNVSATACPHTKPHPALTNYLRDEQTQSSFSEMMTTLERILGPSGQSSGQAAPADSAACFDVTSSHSVLSQLCDKLTALEARVVGLETKVRARGFPFNNHNHNSGNSDQDKPFTQLAHLRQDIKHLKRSAVFSASGRKQVGVASRERINNFNLTVKTGPYFNPDKGVFHVPYEGVYHFSLSYQKPPELSLEASVVVDNVILASTNQEQLPKIDLLTSLKSGQEVWTDVTSNNGSLDSEVNFTFSGYLVH